MAGGRDQVWRTINMPTNRKFSAIKISFDCYFIDYWNYDRFIVYLNNQIMEDLSPTFITKSTPSIIYCALVGGGDVADSHFKSFEYQVDFADSKVSLEISRFGLPLTRIFGLSNFYLQVQFCDENCDVCDNLGKCKICSNGFTLENGICTCGMSEFLDVFYKHYNPTIQCVATCPTGYVPDFDKTCQPGISNLLFQDLQSTSFTNYLFSLLPDNYYTTDTSDFRIFTVNSQSVAGPFQYNEKLLLTPLSLNPNSNILVKFRLYTILFTGSYQVGGYIKLRFNNYPVFEFRDFDSAFGLNIVGQSVINGFTECTYGTELYICKYMDIEFTTYIDYQITAIMLDGQFTIVRPLRAWGIRDFAIYQTIQTSSVSKCTSPCQDCVYNSTKICTSCVTGFYLFDTRCLSQCPSQTTQIGGICNEDSIADTISYALNICYDDGDYQDIIDSIDITSPSISQVPMSKYLHGFQYYSMIGGFNKWLYQVVQYKISTNYQFYKAYIKMSVVCFDCTCSSGNQFEISYGATSYVDCGVLSSVGNIIGAEIGGTTTYVEKEGEVFINVGSFASQNSITLTFQKTSTSTQDYYGIYNLRVMVVQCPIFCTACTLTGSCTTWLVDVSELNGNCVSGYYFDTDTQLCQPCITGCATCTSYTSCSTCNTGFAYYGGGCYCSFKESLSSCSISSTECQPGCQVCGEDGQVNQLGNNYNQVCVKCDESKHLWLDMFNCKCIQGYYMDNDICQLCSPFCKSCDSQPRICTSCDDALNRELHYQYCECKQGYYEEDDNVSCSVCDTTCYTCRFFSDYCTSCHPDQYRKVLNRECVCQDGYFDEGIAICTKCDSKCQTCTNLSICLSCYSTQYRKLSLVTNKCICQVGYFEVENQLYCDHCYYACQECQPSPLQNMCTRCPSSREPSVVDTVFACVCKRGYYESNMKECSDCRYYLNPPSSHYCYSKCGNSKTEWNEDCDNGSSTLASDGCYQCLFTNSYCFNLLCAKCEMGTCVQCIEGYYLTKDSVCEQCDQSCKTCSTRSDNCDTCTITTSTGACLMCQTSQGFQVVNNECKNICGDGLKVTGEECDDGNDKSGDGCQNCIIEEGWICNTVCERIIYPEIIFTPDIYDYQYNGIRNIQVSTSIPLKIEGAITDLCTFTLDDKLATIDQNNDITTYLEDYNILQIQLKVTLKTRSDTPTLTCNIKNSTSFISQQGFTFNETKFQTVMLAFNLQSESVISATQGLMSLSQYILYILLGLAILAFLFGGLEIFWNLLDVLQLISYLQFLNVIYPYNVDTYFQLFDFAQFDFIQNIVDIGTIINEHVDSPDPDYKFAQQGYSTTFFINGTTLFTAFLLTFLTYLGCKYGFILISKILQYYTDDEDTSLEEEPNVIKFILFRIFNNVERMLLKIMGEFRSGLIRTFMAITYDYNLAIFLQIKDVNTNNSVLYASFIVTVFFLGVQCYFVFKGFTLMSKPPYYYQQFYVEQKYGSLYEGVHIRISSPFSNYYNMILLVKKILFIIFLVNLYSAPSLQILMCSFLNIVFITYIIYNRPLEEKYEFLKIVGSEIFIWMAELLILLLYYLQQSDYDEQQQLMVGWFIITDCTLLVLFQLVLDVKQHFEYLVKEFKIIKRLFYRIQILLGKSPEAIETDENLVDIQRSKSTLKNKSSNTILKQRKLVTFRIDT